MAEVADFFVSYTGADRAWAEWVAWQLEQAGYQVIVQAWDFEPGDNFVDRMKDALERADRTLALVSAAYLASPYCRDEWTGAFLHDEDGRNRLLQVRVEDCELPRLLRTQVYVDLVGLLREQARALLLAGVKRGRRKPATEPLFPHDQPGKAGPRFPGSGLEVTNLPPRNPDFAGRATLLEGLHKTLSGGGQAAVVQAATVHGLGGVGKTQLALEYAYRYAVDYDVVWWMPAEQPVAIPGLLAGLAKRLGIPESADPVELLASLWDELRQWDRWLLVYDNAQGPRELAPYRPPAGAGRVLVTSRTPTWRETATVRLDVLEREEAVAFLRQRTGSADTASLGALAEALGDLPLALEQAAAYLDDTHTTPAHYLTLYREHGAVLLAQGAPLTTEQTVATSWQVALEQVRATPAAPDLLSLYAFLAPDAIPRALPGEYAEELPDHLRSTVDRLLVFNQAVSVLGRYSLVAVTADTLTVHRLVQTVVRSTLSPEDQQLWAAAATRLVSAAFPPGSDNVATWPACAMLLPHALAVVDHGQTFGVEPETTALLLIKAATYLRSRGQYRQAMALQEQILAGFRQALGEDHPSTLLSMNNLAEIRRGLGDLQGTHELHEQTLASCRRVLDEDHPVTLTSINNLATTRRALGDLQGAHDLFEQALAALRRVLGDDHPNTMLVMNNLATTRRALGDPHGARDLHEQALAVRRRVLGDDHPDTLLSMNNLATTRRDLGDLQGACALYEQALAAMRQVLGDDHPDTLTAMNNLAVTCQALGDLDGARQLHERALAGSRRVLGDDHPDTLTSLNNLAQVRRAIEQQ